MKPNPNPPSLISKSNSYPSSQTSAQIPHLTPAPNPGVRSWIPLSPQCKPCLLFLNPAPKSQIRTQTEPQPQIPQLVPKPQSLQPWQFAWAEAPTSPLSAHSPSKFHLVPDYGRSVCPHHHPPSPYLVDPAVGQEEAGFEHRKEGKRHSGGKQELPCLKHLQNKLPDKCYTPSPGSQAPATHTRPANCHWSLPSCQNACSSVQPALPSALPFRLILKPRVPSAWDIYTPQPQSGQQDLFN